VVRAINVVGVGRVVRSYIGLGSNLGDSFDTLCAAIRDLTAHAHIEFVAVSRFYSSKPLVKAGSSPADQPDYVNAALAVDTSLSASALLQAMFTVERAHGRVREDGKRWEARTLDLDLLLYGAAIIDKHHLKVPHPELCKRSFVVYPLADLAPDLTLPTGVALADCKANLSGDDLSPLDKAFGF